MNGQKGAVLIMVLWVIALLSMIGGYFTLETTLRRNLSFSQWNMLRAKLAIESVLNLVTPHIRPFGQEENETEEKEFIVPDGSIYKIKIGGETLSFSIEDERGKLDINKASDEELEDFFQGLLGKTQGTMVSDSILDWRDNDDDSRPDGAEKDFYEDLSPPYTPANSRFLLLEQLLLVKGVDPDIYWGPIKWVESDSKDDKASWQGGLQDLVTIYNGSQEMIEDIAAQPLIDILGKEYFKDAQGLGTLRFKTCAYQSCYQIFFKKVGSAKTGFTLVHWQQMPRFQ